MIVDWHSFEAFKVDERKQKETAKNDKECLGITKRDGERSGMDLEMSIWGFDVI